MVKACTMFSKAQSAGHWQANCQAAVPQARALQRSTGCGQLCCNARAGCWDHALFFGEPGWRGNCFSPLTRFCAFQLSCVRQIAVLDGGVNPPLGRGRAAMESLKLVGVGTQMIDYLLVPSCYLIGKRFQKMSQTFHDFRVHVFSFHA
jgi:hypothetical protein